MRLLSNWLRSEGVSEDERVEATLRRKEERYDDADSRKDSLAEGVAFFLRLVLKLRTLLALEVRVVKLNEGGDLRSVEIGAVILMVL